MKREDLFKAIGDLDDALLDENVTEIKKTSKLRYILPIAACLVIAAGVVAVPFLTQGGLPRQPATSVPMAETPAITEEFAQMTETVQATTETLPPVSVAEPFAALPPTEEWMNRVYFGSEFPFFLYGNDDYCVFSEGMDSVFVFDFKEGRITFSANITASFDNAGIPHGGMESWNGVGLSCYLDNGERKLLCTATADGEPTRGFTLDTESGTLTEIPNFNHENLDFEIYVYNKPLGAFDFLFGAAPIPLEDGYICFQTSGLNNDVLPGEGSHLPMIQIEKVKGDVVESWIPFAYMATETE